MRICHHVCLLASRDLRFGTNQPRGVVVRCDFLVFKDNAQHLKVVHSTFGLHLVDCIVLAMANPSRR